jgi:serine/threonine-protein kinase HipA
VSGQGRSGSARRGPRASGARAPLCVFLNGGLVGRLSRDRRGGLSFVYDSAHLDREDAVPVSLSLPLDDRTYAGDQVAAVFENLLPDLPVVRDAMAARLRAEGSDVHSLLAAAGADCVGALQFLPEGRAPSPVGASDGREIHEAGIADRLRSLGRFPLGLGADDDDGGFRISIAGAQEKTALLRRDGRWFVPAGTAATTHILKPAIGRQAALDLSLSVQNEWFCLAVLRALGLPAANAEIHAFEDETALVVERFDRRWADGGVGERRLLRLPQEDLLQALGVPTARKYEADGGPGIAEVCALFGSADDPRRDRTVFLRAQVAYWLLAATDGHAKNFSIFLGPAGRFALAPLYDVMSVQPNLDAGEIARNRAQLAMAIGEGRRRRIDMIQGRHFAQSARAFGLPRVEVEAVLNEIGAVLPRALDHVAGNLPEGFPAPLAESIIAGVRKRLGAANPADSAS